MSMPSNRQSPVSIVRWFPGPASRVLLAVARLRCRRLADPRGRSSRRLDAVSRRPRRKSTARRHRRRRARPSRWRTRRRCGTEPITARVYVMLGPGSSQARARFGPDWFRPQPFFSREVKDWKPGQTVRIDSSADRLPRPARHARARRVRHPGGRPAQSRHARASAPARGTPTARSSTPSSIPKRDGHDQRSRSTSSSLRGSSRRPIGSSSPSCESPLLSAFYHRPIKHRAAVILPEAKPERQAAHGLHHSRASAAIITWRRMITWRARG